MVHNRSVGHLFVTDRAREQVRRILEIVAYPGVACLLDADGCVVAAVGELPGLGAGDLASAFGAHEEAIVDEGRARWASDRGYASFIRPLPGDRKLIVVLPAEVTSVQPRIDRAAELLRRMLRPNAPPSPPPSAHACVFAERPAPRLAGDPDEPEA